MPVFETGSREFESLRAGQIIKFMSLEIIGCIAPGYLSQSTEQRILDILQKQIEQQFPTHQNVICLLSFADQWLNEHKENELKNIVAATNTNIFLVSMFDPPHYLELFQFLFDQPNVYLLGNIAPPGQYFDYWAVNVEEHFKKYTNAQVMLTRQSLQQVFLSYARKPTVPRVNFVELLVQRGLSNQGIYTLGYEPTMTWTAERAKLYTKTLEENLDDEYIKLGQLKINDTATTPNDIWSLGRLDIWQQCFLNVVNETDYVYRQGQPFLSEKTFKPIIGLRPFVINGNPSIYHYLRGNGFHTFNEYWPSDTDFLTDTEHNYHQMKFHICRVIEYLSGLSKKQLWTLYRDMLPKLLENQQRFTEYCRVQWHIIGNQRLGFDGGIDSLRLKM